MVGPYSIPLCEKEVNQILEKMNQEQRAFIELFISRSKKSKWLEKLAHYKGKVLPKNASVDEAEDILDDWVLKEIKDCGFGNRKLRCECGHSLRFQYIVYHKKQNKICALGSTCFENYTGLSTEVINDIKKGFYHIDLERDELLIEWVKGTKDDLSLYRTLKIALPDEIVQQNSLGLPLIKRQWSYIDKLYKEFEEQRIEEERNRKYQQLSEEQKAWIDANFNRDQKSEILNRIRPDKNYETYNTVELEEAGIPERIIKHILLELPLISSDEEIINHYLRRQRQKPLQSLSAPHIQEVKTKVIDYDYIIKVYLEKLKAIRIKETQIPEGLEIDWAYIQNAVRSLKCGKDFDYRIFILKINNLCAALHIY